MGFAQHDAVAKRFSMSPGFPHLLEGDAGFVTTRLTEGRLARGSAKPEDLSRTRPLKIDGTFLGFALAVCEPVPQSPT
jgi:hypothetical protein